MFKFAEPIYLYFLLLVPILMVIQLFSIKAKKRNRKKLGNTELIKQLMPNASKWRPHIKFHLQLLALTLIVIVLARPQFGSKDKIIKKTGINVMLALDVSNSMLCQDAKPSRLKKAKQIISQLIDKMENDRIGLVVFAGSPYIQLPITTDLVSAKMFLSTNPISITPQGTAIGAAIDLCASSLEENSDKSQVIILLSDCENHEDDAAAAATAAAKKGIHTYVIGIGTPEGGPIPLPERNGFLKDKNGKVVVTKLNEKNCHEIARAGEGIYVLADNSNRALHTITEQLNKLSKTEHETTVYMEQDEQFQSFALIALLILMVEFFILFRKNKRLARMRFFDLEEKEEKSLQSNL